MKKILSLLVLLVTLASCEEDVKFNNPAVQGFKNDELWRATNFSAEKSGNALTITATNGFETVVLRTESTAPAAYTLGVNEANKATYTLSVDGINDFYQTGTGVGEGIITISAANTDLTKGYISGTYHFSAENTGGTVVNFRDGVFFKVPISVIP